MGNNRPLSGTEVTRTLMYAPRACAGGVESHVCELTSELLARGAEVTLAVANRFGRTSGARECLETRGAKFVEVVRNHGKGVREFLELASRPAKTYSLGRFDTIVCHGFGMSHVLVAAGRHGARLVWHDHNSGGEVMTNSREFSPPRLEQYPWVFRRFLDCVDRVITGSERGRDHLRNFQRVKSRIHVLPPLCTFRRPRDIESLERRSAVTCGLFGNLGPVKGTEPLLRLWSRPELSQVRLQVFGDDPKGRYARLAESLRLTNVDFRGSYTGDTLVQHAGEVDFAIIASASEGYPLVAIELMACGIPLVATKVGVCPELDPSGKGVILVEHEAESVLMGILRMIEQIKCRAIDRWVLQRRADEIYNRQAIVDQYLEVVGR